MFSIYVSILNKNNKIIVITLFIIALILRLIALGSSSLIFKGSNVNRDFEYGVIARSIIKGKGYSVPINEFNKQSLTEKNGKQKIHSDSFISDGNTQMADFIKFKQTGQYRPSANQLPFYPLFLSIFFYFSTNPFSYWIIKFLQAIISSLTCIVIYLIALKIFNKKAAIVAGFISAFYPVFVLYSIKIVPESIFTFWFSLSVLYLFIFKENPSFKNSVISGCLIGITLLNSNVIVPAMPFIFLWIFLIQVKRNDKFKRTLFIFLIAILFVSPWIARNYLVFGSFPLMKSTAGLNLWIGNNPKATGTFFLQTGESMDSILPNSFYEGLKNYEMDKDKELYKIAISYIKNNSIPTLKIFFKKFIYFLWFPPDNIISKDVKQLKKILKFPYGIFLLSCIIGFIFSLKKYFTDTILLFFIILSITGLYSIFFVGHLRFRMPIEPYLIIFSSYTISAISDRIAFRHFKRK